ncbi:type III-B CRISPR module RAMP protein Cmr1 [Sulfobacillus thermosulfidooxidans]|uniref:type III-B CRISPR module RAMP protein Cmr1 n=1 Tax=Sulfobacillus thermosulfidooxidans TaxID=28034 RepID=UPI0006B6952D|nr:type III-B CRISPR module RAMP protein Cmr1 [Sulfobacillus thermosulfidooxidans]
MQTLEVTYQLVTPAFLEGFKTEKKYMRIREMSIKGLIRFWWRALAYPLYGHDIATLHNREADLFGSTKQNSSVLFLPSEDEGFVVEESSKPFEPYKGIQYLGYGLLPQNDKQPIPPYIKVPWHFTIRLLSKTDFDPLLINAFKILGLIGGMGRRSRRGFGSLSIVNIKHQGKVLWESPKTLTDLTRTLQDILPSPNPANSVLTYTAFGSQTAIYFLAHGSHVFKLWDEVGRQFQMYRSFGRNGKVGSIPAEKNFRDDHDLMQQALNHEPVKQAPRRSIFGLPHNYWFSSGGQLMVTPRGAGDRRASPLMLHLHQLTPEEYVVLASVFPAKFLPGAEPKIGIRVKNSTDISVPGSIEQDYPVINEFITGKVAKAQTSRFPEARCIWP